LPQPSPRADANLGYLFRLAYQSFRALLDGELEDLGLSAQEYGILSVFEIRPELSTSELARISQVTRQTMHTSVLSLEAAGLVERSARNQRVVLVRPTKRGRQCLASHRRELCRMLWQQWSPYWRFDESAFERTAASFGNPDFVDVVIHAYRRSFGLAAGDPDTLVAVALAKAFCSDVAVRAAQETVQLHGGIGFTWEHPAHLYLKRAKADSIGFGTADAHRASLAGLADLPPAGADGS